MNWFEVWTTKGVIVTEPNSLKDSASLEKDKKLKNQLMDTFYASSILFDRYVFVFFGTRLKQVGYSSFFSPPRNSVPL